MYAYALLPRNPTLPRHHVQGPISYVRHRLRIKSLHTTSKGIESICRHILMVYEGMVFSPLLTFFRETGHSDAVHGFRRRRHHQIQPRAKNLGQALYIQYSMYFYFTLGLSGAEGMPSKQVLPFNPHPTVVLVSLAATGQLVQVPVGLGHAKANTKSDKHVTDHPTTGSPLINWS